MTKTSSMKKLILNESSYYTPFYEPIPWYWSLMHSGCTKKDQWHVMAQQHSTFRFSLHLVVFSLGCGLNCKQLNVPVCGNDGKMYTNICMMRLESCRTGKGELLRSWVEIKKHFCKTIYFISQECRIVSNPWIRVRWWVEYKNIRVAGSISLHSLLRKK